MYKKQMFVNKGNQIKGNANKAVMILIGLTIGCESLSFYQREPEALGLTGLLSKMYPAV